MIWNENHENEYCEITPAILALKEQWEKENYIDPALYKEYNVKRGLRDEDGRGVLTGLTRVAEIQSYNVTPDEHIVPTDGVLYYRGIDCRHLVTGSEKRGRFAFEEAAYLLLFGKLPTQAQLDDFCGQLASYRTLPTNFFRDIIMKAPPRDLMNTMQMSILTLY
ncbi:MAG: citrate synthase, partial [Oscillospiraceae bacterium]|nr:citrate synthase [Oscillospiraceae bacterium]